MREVTLFSSEMFRADPKTKGLLNKDHLEALDGLEVHFNKKDESWGTIPSYEVNEEEFTLYPVYKQWCLTQMALF